MLYNLTKGYDNHGEQRGKKRKLDVSRQTVNAIEREKYDPSLPLAFKIAEVFDLLIEEVFDPAA